MFTTVAQVLEFVKQEYQINSADTSNDTYLNSCITRNYYNRSQRFPWKQRIVQGAAFTTATTQQTYAVSSDFARLVPNSVRYGVTSGTDSSNPPDGYFLPEVPFENREYYRGCMTGSDPQYCTIIGSTAAVGKALYLFPAFTNSGSVVNYDYYSQASSLSSSATLPIQELGFVIAYDTLRDYAVHLKNAERQAQYTQLAREAWQSAFVNILPDQ